MEEFFEKPSHLRILEREAFGNCSALQEIEIPASVEEIGSDCFGAAFYDGCCSLERVTFEKGSRLRKISPESLPWLERVNNFPKECGYYWDDETGIQECLKEEK